MNLVPLMASAVRLHQALPYSVFDDKGNLLLPKGAMIQSEDQRAQLLSRGSFVDKSESESYHRAFIGKLDSMVRRNVLIKQLVDTQPDDDSKSGTTSSSGRSPSRKLDIVAAWLEIEFRAPMLLSDFPREDWLSRFQKFRIEISELISRDPDGSLFVLLQALRDSSNRYSTKHALLVAVVCELTARQLNLWPDEARGVLCCAALTMNMSMMQLQDQLATQDHRPLPDQWDIVKQHPESTVEILRAAGVQDKTWLQAVALHHSTEPGPLAPRALGEQLARLIQRADIFAARMSPRATRRAMSATAAAQAIYNDETEKPDEAGGAILKALGLYPPGCFVRLKNGEVAVALARGQRANEPLVASVVSRDGLPLGEPTLRDTRIALFHTAGGVAAHDVKVLLHPLNLLNKRPAPRAC